MILVEFANGKWQFQTPSWISAGDFSTKFSKRCSSDKNYNVVIETNNIITTPGYS